MTGVAAGGGNGSEVLFEVYCYNFYFVVLCADRGGNLARVIDQGQPSFTAFTAAAARAAHLIVDDEPRIFTDTLAGAMLGERAGELIGFHRAHGTHPVLAGARAQVTCRSRYMAALLRLHGFGRVRDVRQHDMIPAAGWERTDALRPADLSRIAHAAVPGR